MRKLKRLKTSVQPHSLLIAGTVLQFALVFLLFAPQVAAVTRFASRSLFIYDIEPGATTSYKLSFTYTTPTTVGSLDLLFCNDPIPDVPCVAPPGLDVSGATLSEQHGVTGYSISAKSPNHLVLTRAPSVVSSTLSTYTFSNIVNPDNTSGSFALRMSDYASTDASGPLIDLGSVLSETNVGVTIETQVPPILVFCVGQQVAEDCSSTNGTNYSDLGELSSSKTLTATSQMAVGTNASRGFAIAAYGTTMAAGTHVIEPLATPTVSAPGNSQFGINLRANSVPSVGSNPDGTFTNAQPTAAYNQPNKYTYNDGDVIAGAPNVSLVRRFTVSYIINVPPDLRPGVYTTTLTYICTGRF